MTDHSEARVEAAARAMNRLPRPWASLTPAQRHYCRGGATDVLAAADEVDRAAGVVRVDTNDEATADRFAMILHHYEYHGEPGAAAECWAADDAAIDSHNAYREQAAYILGALSVLAGAQPPPEGQP